MASVLIKNLPDHLHERLKDRAQRHHRSVNKELIALIEAALREPTAQPIPEPVRLRRPLTQEMLDQARDEGRA